jgi:hypothetical protein
MQMLAIRNNKRTADPKNPLGGKTEQMPVQPFVEEADLSAGCIEEIPARTSGNLPSGLGMIMEIAEALRNRDKSHSC